MDITIHLSDEQREKLSYIQQNSDLDVETLLNHAINQQYEQLQPSKPNSLEILRNSGFIGCSTGDSDLSSNYKAILAKEWSEKYDNR
ncbi:MAG: hypothetical protein AB4041_05620 [Microcystaceae cyanobacterium]